MTRRERRMVRGNAAWLKDSGPCAPTAVEPAPTPMPQESEPSRVVRLENELAQALAQRDQAIEQRNADRAAFASSHPEFRIAVRLSAEVVERVKLDKLQAMLQQHVDAELASWRPKQAPAATIHINGPMLDVSQAEDTFRSIRDAFAQTMWLTDISRATWDSVNTLAVARDKTETTTP